MFDLPRASGILLHVTSLPGPFGIGDLGDEAYRFVDFLKAAGQQMWQVMPLGPTGYGDSPYQALSAFAGNPLLISPAQLVADGLLPSDALADVPPFPVDRVDYGAVIAWKLPLLERSFAHFQAHAPSDQRERFAAFCQAERSWLDDFALFMALKVEQAGARWDVWPPPLRTRQPAALAEWANRLAPALQAQRYQQWLFAQQWRRLRAYANARGVRLIGDLPIFVAYDSADVWANPELFHLDAAGQPTVVAGVPPDYFSATGQLWGNPLYRWEAMAERGYDWWIRRLGAALRAFDAIRIDHFRGFVACWEVPAHAATAAEGRWAPGPGEDLFAAAQATLGPLPIIAEDLGLITADVEALRRKLGFPGMAVLQFAFGGPASHPYLPHNLDRRTVVYTGTHDNDTTLGWYRSAPAAVQDHVRRYLARADHEIVGALVRAALASVADWAILPLQDVLGLGSEARMNRPGQAAGNWTWRMRWEQIEWWLAPNLAEMTALYGRLTTQEASPHAAERSAAS